MTNNIVCLSFRLLVMLPWPQYFGLGLDQLTSVEKKKSHPSTCSYGR